MDRLSVRRNLTPEHSPNHAKLGISTPLKLRPNVADGAPLWIDRRCEVILVAFAPKYRLTMDSHHVCRINNLSSTSAHICKVFHNLCSFLVLLLSNRREVILSMSGGVMRWPVGLPGLVRLVHLKRCCGTSASTLLHSRHLLVVFQQLLIRSYLYIVWLYTLKIKPHTRTS